MLEVLAVSIEAFPAPGSEIVKSLASLVRHWHTETTSHNAIIDSPQKHTVSIAADSQRPLLSLVVVLCLPNSGKSLDLSWATSPHLRCSEPNL